MYANEALLSIKAIMLIQTQNNTLKQNLIVGNELKHRDCDKL